MNDTESNLIFYDDGVFGPDVSFYQDDNETPQQINFLMMKAEGAWYVVIRGGQNVWIDPDFAHNWQQAKLAGLLRGAYWLYDSRADPVGQANRFADLFVNDPPEMELWLDLEEYYGGMWQGYANWKKFLVQLKLRIPNSRIGIYTGSYYISGKIPLAEYAFFAQFMLWIAWYTHNPINVVIPRPWISALFWQWGTPPWGIRFGCESIEIDMNKYNGTKEQFNLRYGGVVIPPPIGDAMRYKVVWAGGVARRSAPSTSNSATSATPYTLNQVVDVLQDNIPDAVSPTDVNKKWVKFSDGLFGASNYPDGTGPKVRMIKVEDNPTTPVRTHTIDVFSDGSLLVDGNPIP